MATVEKILSIAKGEMGTKENPANSNNVKYNTWYYGRAVNDTATSKYPWCMAFVQWVFAQAGMKLPCRTASCSALLNWYKTNRPTRVVKTPEPGDIVIYNFGHTGIVEAAGNPTIVAIEGNTSPGAAGSQSNGGMVCRRTRSMSLVTAYIRPEYEEEEMNIDKLTDADVLKLANRMQNVLAKQPVSAKLASEFAEATDLGITDGTRPMAFTTRAQTAVMTLRAAKK